MTNDASVCFVASSQQRVLAEFVESVGSCEPSAPINYTETAESCAQGFRTQATDVIELSEQIVPIMGFAWTSPSTGKPKLPLLLQPPDIMDSLDTMEKKLHAMGFRTSSTHAIFTFGAALAAIDVPSTAKIDEIIMDLVDEGLLSRSDCFSDSLVSTNVEANLLNAGSASA